MVEVRASLFLKALFLLPELDDEVDSDDPNGDDFTGDDLTGVFFFGVGDLK